MSGKRSDYQTYWQQHVDGYRNGTLTKKSYCKTHQLKYHQFGYWLKKFKQTEDLIPIRVKPTPKTTPVAQALPLSVTGSTVLCTLRLHQGLCLEIYDVNVLSVILNGVCSGAV